MLKIKKNILYDENNNPIAVQIPYNDFKVIEDILENYGLSKLMDEVDEDDLLSYEEAKNYYNSLTICKPSIK